MINNLQRVFASGLSGVDDVADYVAKYKAHLRTEMAQLDKDTQAHHLEVPQANARAAQIVTDIAQLRERADTTEGQITGMTAAIKRLDDAKQNLVTSITVLKRLQMLSTAYDQLTVLVDRRDYEDAVPHLAAVNELMIYFKPYRTIDHIAELSKRVTETESQLGETILQDFQKALDGSIGISPASLVSACSVLDVIGNGFPQRLQDWYTNTQLKSYRTIFSASDEAGSLDNIATRFSYFRRLLNEHDAERAKYFAPTYNMDVALCKGFCTTTRSDVSSILQGLGKSVDVKLLLDALNETLSFEQTLDKRFRSRARQGTVDLDSLKTISMAFQPHLNVWIAHQDKILSSKLQGYRMPQPPSEDGDSRPSVLPSSADLFFTYRQMLEQTAKLSSGPPLLDLYRLFARRLDNYATSVVRGTLPQRVTNEESLYTACMVLNTAEYCTQTVAQLESKLTEQIDDDLKDKVSFDPQRDTFMTIINESIAALVGKIEHDLEYSWREMKNTNWNINTVGDSSSYVRQLCQVLSTDAAQILNAMDKPAFAGIFCDRVVEVVSNSFLQGIIDCRPLTEVAAEQLLVDLFVIKESLLKLPTLKSTENGEPVQPSSRYTKNVAHVVSRIETLLKVVLTRPAPRDGLIQNYFILVGDKSRSNFVKILELKGIPRYEHNSYLEQFHLLLGEQENLIEDSPVMSGVKLTALQSFERKPPNSPNMPLFDTKNIFSGLSKGGLDSIGSLSKISQKVRRG